MKKLSRNGYIILKSDYNTKELKEIKDELTAKPYTIDDYCRIMKEIADGLTFIHGLNIAWIFSSVEKSGPFFSISFNS